MTDSGVSTAFAAVVHNPTKIDRDEVATDLTGGEAAAGFGASRWIETTEDDPGVAMARQAVEEGAQLVIAAGGDGTVRAVAEGLRGSGVPMGILPAGTGNLLARNLGIPLNNVADAIGVAFGGADRSIDVGAVDFTVSSGTRRSSCFVVMAGIGLDADMLDKTDEDLKKKVGWIAYVKAGAAALRDGRHRSVRYRLDQHREHRLRVHTLLVGNCGTVQGGVAVLPNAEPDDGVLDIAFLHPEGALGWVQVATHVLVGSRFRRTQETGGSARRSVRNMTGTAIAVRLPEPENLDLDGDLIEDVREFSCSVEPGALTVRVPN